MYNEALAPVIGDSRVDYACRYGHSEVTGGRYSNRRNQEEEGGQEAELKEIEDAQEMMATEEAAESRKGQLHSFSSACFFLSTGRCSNTSDACISTAGVTPFAKEAGSPVTPSLTPSE